ncbi:MAG: DnaJ domain-containing protein [Bacteroidales bacterium]|nr:DnaJ domain-containing protein [Bacteroidales bacterium]MBN2756310.1 DnaJ domain-containing protein [Bacteroidales bacterium]
MKFNDYISNIFAVISGFFGLIAAYPVFQNRIGTFIVSLIFAAIGYTYGIKLLSGLGGPTLRIWLITGNIGIDFLDLSIQIFKADKKITQNEIERVRIYMTEEFGEEIGIESEKYVMKNYKKRIDVKRICNSYISMKHSFRLTFYYQLFGIAASSGSISEKEENLLMIIAYHLRIGKKSYSYVKNNFVKNEEPKISNTNDYKEYSNKSSTFINNFLSSSINAYIILGVNRNSSISEIKKSYRKLVKQYHPDMITDTTDLFKKKAKEKFIEINDSYEYLKKYKGFN